MSNQCSTHKYQFEGAVLLELRSTGCQTVFPPSIHESGEAIEFTNPLTIKGISTHELQTAVNELAAATLLSRVWNKAKGSRHHAAMTLAGGLQRAGWSEEKATRLVGAVVTVARDNEAHDRIRAVGDTYRAKEGDKTTGWPKLAELLGEQAVETVRGWLGVNQEGSAVFGSTQPSELTVIRASEVLRKPIEWLWPGRIPLRKITLLQGDPGLGKSLITLVLPKHVTTGTPWPVENSLCPLGEVLCVSGEDDAADTIGPRLDALGADSSRFFLILNARGMDNKQGKPIVRAVALDRDVERIAAEIKRLTHCKLVIIDPIGEYTGDVDSHNNAQVRAMLAPLREMAADLGVAIVMVNHFTKNS